LGRSTLEHKASKIGGVIGKKWVVANPDRCDVQRNMKPANESASNWGEERDCALCPLSRIKAGVEVRVKQLCATPEVATRLREIGFGEEQIIKLITSQANIICLVCNARMAISARLAQVILVEPLSLAKAD
jgi:Fe2+ transport system protein FeoA